MKRSLIARRLGLGALILVLLGAVALVARKSGPLAAVEVTVAQVAQAQIQPSIFGIGTVEARRSWMVGPTQAGRVLSVRADVGQLVKAGEVLAEMDSVDLDERVRALDASMARAASLQAAAQSQVADAAARLELAALNAQRNQDLAARHFISAGALESRLQEKTSAQAAHQSALANAAGAGQDGLRLKSERAALLRQKGNTRLLAPADGLVITRDAEAGSTVLAGQPVLRLIDPGSLWVRMRVDQGRSAGLAAGLVARIVLRSQPLVTFTGRVARVEPVADSVTEERIAQVSFELPPGASAAIGELAEVVLTLPAAGSALVVPNAALQHQQGQTGVWRLQDGAPAFAPVRTGSASLDGQVQVLDGLQAGDRIVVHSQQALKTGARLKVVASLVAGSSAQEATP